MRLFEPLSNRFAAGFARVCLILCMLLLVSVFQTGCSNEQWDAFKVEVDQKQKDLTAAQAEAERLLRENNVLAEALKAAQDTAPPPDSPEFPEWQARMTALEAQVAKGQAALTDTLAKADKYKHDLDAVLDSIDQAQTPEEGAGNAIKTGGAIIGTAIGHPEVTAITTLLGTLLGWLGTRRREQAKGAGAVAAGIEAARVPTTANDTFTFTKAAATKNHKALGVLDAVIKASMNGSKGV